MTTPPETASLRITKRYASGCQRLPTQIDILDHALTQDELWEALDHGIRWILRLTGGADGGFSPIRSQLVKEMESIWAFWRDGKRAEDFKTVPDSTLKVLLLDCWHHMRLLNVEYSMDTDPPKERGMTPQHSPLAAWYDKEFGEPKSPASEP